MSMWSKEYVRCRECTFSRKKHNAVTGKVVYICCKNGEQSYGCESGSKQTETEYLFQNYKRRITYV